MTHAYMLARNFGVSAETAVRRALASVTIVAIAACAVDGRTDPLALPYRVDVSRLTGQAMPADLDGDGRDELIVVYRPTDHVTRPDLEAVQVFAPEGHLVAQINFIGRVLPVHVLDVDNRGDREIVVPTVRGDSLFITIANGAGEKLHSFFMTHGAPRRDPDGVIPWDPVVLAAHAGDVTGDGRPDLVTVLATGYARAPRGVFVHSLPQGRELGRLLLGAKFHRSFIGDFDNDGSPEVVLAAWPTRNGASVGGFDDAHGYLIVVSLRGGPRVVLRRDFSDVSPILLRDSSATDRADFIVLLAGPNTSRLEVLESGTWRVTRERPLAGDFRWAAIGDFNRAPGSELALTKADGSLMVLDNHLNELDRGRLPGAGGYWTAAIPDLDGDGHDELFRLHETTQVLSPSGALLAIIPVDSVQPFEDALIRVYRPLPMAPPQLILRMHNGRSVVTRALPNRLYLVQRYSTRLAAAIGVVAILGLAAGLTRAQARQQRQRSVQAAALDGAADGFLLLTRRGRVEWINETLQRWLELTSAQVRRPVTAARLFGNNPALHDFCRELTRTVNPHHREAQVILSNGAQDRRVSLLAEPIALGRGGADWLIRVEHIDRNGSDEEARAWALMAQRIAHDLKNPLTSILLTLQRMRQEYREHAPGSAAALDTYSRRIEDRIDHLRRMTTNFMKFVHVDDPVLTPLTLLTFADAQATSLRRTLPDDIELRVRPSNANPVVAIDQEQFASVLENLVANAVNAMPDGGSITISVSLSQAMLVTGRRSATEFALLEIMDTGVGIPSDILGRVFEPGFTTTRHGSGLGLAIVKKVVTDHGGEVAVESQVGSGTIVSIYLPIAEKRADVGTVPAAAATTMED